MATEKIRVRGSDLREGDLVEWFTDGRTVKITALRPYDHRLAKLFRAGAQLADFGGQIPSGATIDNSELYVVLR